MSCACAGRATNTSAAAKYRPMAVSLKVERIVAAGSSFVEEGNMRSLLCVTLTGALVSSAAAVDTKIVMEEFMVPAADPGISLYVRNKHSAAMKAFSAEKTLLYVHGATYPAETAFDLQLNGLSWMDYVAQRGYDVYLVDVRGYGRATRPPEMDRPAHEKALVVGHDDHGLVHGSE